MTEFNDLLKKAIGNQIDITVIHHVEGRSLITTGKLIEVTEDYLAIEILYRDHFWSRKIRHVYYLNRNSCSLLSLVVHDV